MKAMILITGVLLSLGLSTACAKTDPEQTSPVADKSEAVPAEANAPREKTSYEFGDAMRIPVDGSSIESFDQSLETIKAKSPVSEYETLSGAINYLMVYDLGAHRDRAKLALRLDGLTGEQIVDRVNWDKKPGKNRKAKAKPPAKADQ